MLDQQLLNDLNTVVGSYNKYFLDLSSGAAAAPNVPKYTAEELGAALEEALAPQDDGEIDSETFSEASQAAKVGFSLIEMNNTAQSFTVGRTRGGYGSEL